VGDFPVPFFTFTKFRDVTTSRAVLELYIVARPAAASPANVFGTPVCAYLSGPLSSNLTTGSSFVVVAPESRELGPVLMYPLQYASVIGFKLSAMSTIGPV
jgi:hypothetical protein